MTQRDNRCIYVTFYFKSLSSHEDSILNKRSIDFRDKEIGLALQAWIHPELAIGWKSCLASLDLYFFILKNGDINTCPHHRLILRIN